MFPFKQSPCFNTTLLLGTQNWILKDSFTELFILTKIPVDDNDDNDDDYEDDKNYDEDLMFSWLCVLQIQFPEL